MPRKNTSHLEQERRRQVENFHLDQAEAPRSGQEAAQQKSFEHLRRKKPRLTGSREFKI